MAGKKEGEEDWRCQCPRYHRFEDGEEVTCTNCNNSSQYSTDGYCANDYHTEWKRFAHAVPGEVPTCCGSKGKYANYWCAAFWIKTHNRKTQEAKGATKGAKGSTGTTTIGWYDDEIVGGKGTKDGNSGEIRQVRDECGGLKLDVALLKVEVNSLHEQIAELKRAVGQLQEVLLSCSVVNSSSSSVAIDGEPKKK